MNSIKAFLNVQFSKEKKQRRGRPMRDRDAIVIAYTYS